MNYLLKVMDVFKDYADGREVVRAQTTNGDVYEFIDSALLTDIPHFINRVDLRGTIDRSRWFMLTVPDRAGMSFSEYFDGEYIRYRDSRFFGR